MLAIDVRLRLRGERRHAARAAIAREGGCARLLTVEIRRRVLVLPGLRVVVLVALVRIERDVSTFRRGGRVAELTLLVPHFDVGVRAVELASLGADVLDGANLRDHAARLDLVAHLRHVSRVDVTDAHHPAVLVLHVDARAEAFGLGRDVDDPARAQGLGRVDLAPCRRPGIHPLVRLRRAGHLALDVPGAGQARDVRAGDELLGSLGRVRLGREVRGRRVMRGVRLRRGGLLRRRLLRRRLGRGLLLRRRLGRRGLGCCVGDASARGGGRARRRQTAGLRVHLSELPPRVLELRLVLGVGALDLLLELRAHAVDPLAVLGGFVDFVVALVNPVPAVEHRLRRAEGGLLGHRLGGAQRVLARLDVLSLRQVRAGLPRVSRRLQHLVARGLPERRGRVRDRLHVVALPEVGARVRGVEEADRVGLLAGVVARRFLVLLQFAELIQGGLDAPVALRDGMPDVDAGPRYAVGPPHGADGRRNGGDGPHEAVDRAGHHLQRAPDLGHHRVLVDRLRRAARVVQIALSVLRELLAPRDLGQELLPRLVHRTSPGSARRGSAPRDHATARCPRGPASTEGSDASCGIASEAHRRGATTRAQRRFVMRLGRKSTRGSPRQETYRPRRGRRSRPRRGPTPSGGTWGRSPGASRRRRTLRWSRPTCCTGDGGPRVVVRPPF